MSIIIIGPVEIFVCTTDLQPCMADAIVEEQDTNLILGTRPVIRDTQESYSSLVRKMNRQKPLMPGQIIIRNTKPVSFIAVLYDIEREPVCTEEIITTAFNDLLDKFNEFKLKSVAMPILGSTYCKGIESVFIKLLHVLLTNRESAYPEKIVLMVQPDEIEDICEIIEAYRNE